MIKAVVNGINIFNPIEGKMDEIIDYFVEFYGEKYRERITNRLKNARYFFVPREGSHNVSDRIHSYYNNKIAELENELFFSFPNYEPNRYLVFNINIAKAIKSRLLLGQLNISDYPTIDDIIASFGLDGGALVRDNKESTNSKEWLKDRKNFNKLKLLLTSIINEWREKYAPIAEELNKERNNALMQVKQYDEIIKENKKKTSANIKRAVILYLLEERPDIKDANREKLLKNVDTYISLLKMGKNEFLRRGKFYYNFFSQCITFFNALGYNLGDDIREYKNNCELMDFLFNNKIQAIFKKESLDAQKFELLNNPYILEAFQRMSEINFKHNDQSHIASMLAFAIKKLSAEAFIRNYLSPDNKLENVCICADGLDVSRDSLFHEMNHIIESDVISINDDGFITKCGLDVIEFNEKTQHLSEISPRKYELLNEVINDYFAISVSNIAEAYGNDICLGQRIQSVYALCFPLLRGFINKYKEELIDARMSNNPLKFAQKFGKEKYDRLASLVDNFFEIVLDENKLTRIFADITIKTGERGNPLNRIDRYAKMNINWSEDTKEIFNCYREIKRITEDDLSTKREQEDRKYIVATTIKKDDREK